MKRTAEMADQHIEGPNAYAELERRVASSMTYGSFSCLGDKDEWAGLARDLHVRFYIEGMCCCDSNARLHCVFFSWRRK